MKTMSKAKQTVFISAFGEFTFSSLGVIMGIVLFAFYERLKCDPFKQGVISSPNIVVPHFVMENLNYPGVPGLFSASVVAASLSSLSSFLNSSAAILWDDFGRLICPNVSTQKATNISKCIVLILGILSTSFAVTVQYLGGTILHLNRSLSVVAIPVYGVFIAGLFCPWFNKKGLLAGSICSLGLIMWICLGQFYVDTFSRTMLPT